MEDDMSLLRQFVEHGSEAAFGELVSRHIDAVYSTALRLSNGQTGFAADIAQTVFTDLARKASRLPPGTLLGGWLYRATRNAAAAALRSDRRRAAREMEAIMLQETNRTPGEASWESVRPVLDDALDELKEPDRDALLLRFFQQQSLREVGGALGVSEDAARMRIDRALDRLRTILAARGVPSTVAALGLVLEGHVVASAPALFAQTVSAAAITAAAAPISVLSITAIMTATTKIAATAAVALLLAVPLIYQHRAMRRLEAENAELKVQAARGATEPDSPSAGTNDIAQLKMEMARLRSEVAAKRSLEKELAAAKAALVRAPGAASAVKSPAETEEEDKSLNTKIRYARLDFSRYFGLRVFLFAKQHDGRFPGPQDDISVLSVPATQVGDVRLTADSLELLASGSLTQIAHPQDTIIARERDPWAVPETGNLARTYLFADGHSGIRTYPSVAEMEAWEQQHLPGTGEK